MHLSNAACYVTNFSDVKSSAAPGGRATSRTVDLSLAPRGELSTGPELLQSPEDVQLPGVASDVGCSAMSDRGAGATEAVVPFAPKPNAKPEAGDPLDRAAQAVLGLLHRAAADAEANYQQALEMTRQLSAQLRAAEDRIGEA